MNMKLFDFRMLYFFLLMAISCEVTHSYEIRRTLDSTLIRFYPVDLLARSTGMSSSGFIEEEMIGRACVINAPPIDLSGNYSLRASLSIKEAESRNFIAEILDLSYRSILRLNVKVENNTGDSQISSGFLQMVGIGKVDLIAQTTRGVEALVSTNRSLEIQTDIILISGEKITSSQICDIAPFTSFTVQYLDLLITNTGDSQLIPLTSEVAPPLSCFNTGLFLANCQLEDTTLSAKNDVDLEYEVDLSFECRGHEVDFALKTDESVTLIKPARGKQKLKVTGTELRLVDLNPAKTSRATFDLGCNLHVDRVHKRLSTRAKRTFQNYLKEVQLLTQVLNDMRRVDSLTKDLTINMLQTNPGQLIWAAKSIKQTLDGIIERTENASEKTELQKASAHLNLVTLDDKLASQAALQKEIGKIQNLLKNTMGLRISSILDRLIDIQLRIAGMSALLDVDERQEEKDLEEQINKAKKTFL